MRRPSSSPTLLLLLCGLTTGTSYGQLVWSPLSRQTASSPAADDNFGCSASISGSWAAAGAQQPTSSPGFVTMFALSSGAWTYSSSLTASDATNDDNFGHAVSISGDYLAVGAYKRTSSSPTTSDSGGVYIFNRSGSSWTEMGSGPLLARTGPAGSSSSDTEADAWFGYSVAMSGIWLVVGAPYKDGGSADQGAAYVFKYNSGSGNWEYFQKLAMSGGYSLSLGDKFGWSVATNGTTILVGARGDDATSSTDTGACYEYVYSGSSWDLNSTTPKVTAGGLLGNKGQFGFSLATAKMAFLSSANSDTAYVVGTLRYNNNDIIADPNYSGTAIVMWRDGSNAWQSIALTSPNAIPPSTSGGDGFGISVATNDEGRILIGSNESLSGSVDNGQAFLFQPDPNNIGLWILESTFNPTSPLGNGSSDDLDWFGRAVAIDGTSVTANILVGSHFGETGSASDAGVVYFATASCYANCDGSTSLPVLTPNDYNCFLNKYAAGDSYANCDGSTTAPVLNANDFNCFLNKYAAGCT